MPQGLMIWDASGNTVLDYTTRCGRILGVATTGTSNGSMTVAGADTGTLFATAVTIGNYDLGYSNAYPIFTCSGSTISWVFSTFVASTGESQINGNTTFVYGVY